MPGARSVSRRRRLLPAAGAACALALVGSTLTVLPAAGGPALAVSAAAPADAPAAVPAANKARSPRVTALKLSGIDRALLAKAPAPQAEPGSGQLSQQAVRKPLKPAVVVKRTIAHPAELVAVSSSKALPAGSSIQVRVKDAGGWGKWTELDMDGEHGPDPGSAEAAKARVGSDPLLAVNATKVRVRIDTPTGRVPAGTTLTLVDAPKSSGDGRTGTVTQLANAGQPSIISRAQWGADESLRSRAPYYTDNVRAGFVHHTASSSSYSRSGAAAQVRAIYAYHTKSLKHSDIDYNFVVDRFGRLYEGRAGGINRAVLGGHTAGFNEHTFAVVALGNFDTFKPASADMAAMRDSVARLFAWKLGLSGVSPTATVKLRSAGYIKATRYPKGSIATLPAISSHRMVNYTACPGRYIQEQLPAIRALAASYSKVVVSAPSPVGTSVPYGTGSVSLASWTTKAVTWTADILSPCSDTPVRRFTGTTTKAGAIPLTWDLRDSKGARVLPATYTVRVTGAAGGVPVAMVSSTLTVTPKSGQAWGPCANVSRVVGADSATTSVLWGRLSAPSSKTVVVTGAGTSAALQAAGLTAAPLASALGAPLLLTAPSALSSAVAAEVKARAATHAIVVGSTSVVSDAAVTSLKALKVSVTRVAGTTPAKTAAAVATRIPNRSGAVVISPDGSPAHAIAGAALASARGVPVLLAKGATIPAETRAALAGRTAVTVVAPASVLSDALVPGATRLTGADASAASAAVVSAFPASAPAAVLLPESPASWATSPVAAASGVPVLVTTSPSLSPTTAAVITKRPALRAVTTPVSGSWAGDDLLGDVSRVLLGLPWAPPGVTLAPPVSAKAAPVYQLTRANGKPEPVKKGTKITLTSKVTTKATGAAKYKKVPAGRTFSVQFKATGKTKYKTLARALTIKGKARVQMPAKTSGRWRIVIGSKVSASDFVPVVK